MIQNDPTPRDLFVGELNREFSLSLDDKWSLDAPGGNALYASCGYLIWEKEHVPGICTRVGENFHHDWLEGFGKRGINTEGVVVLPRALDHRVCYVQEGDQTQQVDDPVSYFSKAGLTLPPALIGYARQNLITQSRRTSRENSIRESDIPQSYLTATGAHLCPLDYLSHNLLPAIFRQQGFSTITLDPGSSYMDPNFLSDIPGLMPGLTAFMPSEGDLKNLFKGVSTDIWEMAAELGRFGCELIVIKRGAAGQYLYEPASGRKWAISSYPARVKNPIGAGDAFCGGFLAGFRRSYDPLQAVLYGSVASSLAVEGSGPFYPLEALPGLATARLEYLQGAVREI
ncbi:MAG: carbohydrate kinase family protein [Anaerolineales bacterium]